MAAENPQGTPQSGKSILIIDDEEDIRNSLESRLKTAGFRVQTASSGQEAVETFIKYFYDGPFDVILLDINMPDMDGIDVLKLLRQEEELRGVKDVDGVIVVMQTGMKESWMDAFQKGCDDYIIKPYSFQELLNKINEKIQIKKERSELR